MLSLTGSHGERLRYALGDLWVCFAKSASRMDGIHTVVAPRRHDVWPTQAGLTKHPSIQKQLLRRLSRRGHVSAFRCRVVLTESSRGTEKVHSTWVACMRAAARTIDGGVAKSDDAASSLIPLVPGPWIGGLHPPRRGCMYVGVHGLPLSQPFTRPEKKILCETLNHTAISFSRSNLLPCLCSPSKVERRWKGWAVVSA
jgi:hypothetical protein